MEKKTYKGKYPSAARHLINNGFASTPRQKVRNLEWAEGIDIVYTLKNMTPASFRKNADLLLNLAEAEAHRYEEYKWKFASFDVRLGRLKGRGDLSDIHTFKSRMNQDSEVTVWGPGYDTPTKDHLVDKVEDILDIAQRYHDKVNKQNPYRVVRLVVSIREPR